MPIVIDRPARDILNRLASSAITVEEVARESGHSTQQVTSVVEGLRAAGVTIRQDVDGRLEIGPSEYPGCVALQLSVPISIEYHRTIGSTNDRARTLGREGTEDVVVIADQQTGGHGRQGRSWASPPGGIWCTLLVRPSIPPDRRVLLTFAAAVAVCEAIDTHAVSGRIKWPNDVLVGEPGRKVAGILTQSGQSKTGVRWVAVGIGVNADIDPDILPEGAASLQEFGEPVDRCALTRDLLEGFYALKDNPDAIRRRWRERAETLGRNVKVETPSGAVIGTAEDIEETGALRIKTDDGVRIVSVGDCDHLRPS